MQAPHAPTLRSEQQASHAVQKPLTGSAQRWVPAPAWSNRRAREALVLRSCGKAAAPGKRAAKNRRQKENRRARREAAAAARQALGEAAGGNGGRRGGTAVVREPVLSVSGLTRRIKQLLEAEIGHAWVEGEIINHRTPGSGHVNFS